MPGEAIGFLDHFLGIEPDRFAPDSPLTRGAIQRALTAGHRPALQA
jgi:hypothetical protein